MNNRDTLSSDQKCLRIIQGAGMVAIAGLSLLYAIFRQRVSEKFINLPSLNSPIFVGEIVLAGCLLLLAGKLFLDCRNKELKFNWLYCGIAVYCFWITGMAFTGFAKVGAYAFRNAALFYYALFAVLGFHFYNKEIFRKIALGLLAGGALLITGGWITLYFQLPLLCVFVFLLFGYTRGWMRTLGIVFLLAVFVLKFSGMTFVHRSHMAGVLGALVFLFLFLLRYAPTSSRLGKGLIVAVFSIAVLLIYTYLGSNVRKSFDLDGIMTEYRHFDRYIKENKNFFIFYEVPPKLYQNDEVKYERRPLTPEEDRQRADPYPDKAMVWPAGDWVAHNMAQNVMEPEEEQAVPESNKGFLSRFAPKHKGRNINQSRNQILFRIFIWRDMLADLKAYPLSFVTGVGFYKSQRSHSIEILGWGRQEWGRDGWITPHNSYFNLIYRGGVIGWALIGAVLFTIVWMAMVLGRRRIFTGGLLIAALVYWIVISNFLVYLEVPHTAIPFWSFLGVVGAYCRDCMKERPSSQR